MAFRMLNSASLFSSRAGGVLGVRSFATKKSESLVEYMAGVPESTWNGGGARKAQVTTLSNGLRVASISSSYPSSAVGLFINTGSRFETHHEAGSTHALKHLAFQSSKERFGIEVVREIECAGATLNATTSREHLVFSSEVPSEGAKTVLSVFKGIMEPSLPYHEVAFAAPVIEADTERLASCQVTRLIDIVHKVAYRHKGLGRPIVPSKDEIHHIDHESLAKFVKSNYSTSNAVVVGVGFDHDSFVEQVKEEFDSVTSSGSAQQPQKSQYVGGEHIESGSGSTRVAIAFEGFGANASPKDVLSTYVLQHVFGRGISSVNAGNTVGGGSASRLTTNVLNKAENVEAVSAFNFTYSDSGLFGIYLETSNGTSSAVEAIKGEIAAAKKKIDEKDVQRGKAAYKAALLEAGDKRMTILATIGAQVYAGGKVYTPEEIAKQVDEITAADVSKAAQKIFSSKPTVVAIGNVTDLPAV